MCGLFGFSCKSYSKKLDVATPILALMMEERGDHSFGLSDGSEIIKDTGAISSHLTKDMYSGRQQVLGHTRFATSGSRTKENAHPWRFGEGDNFIIGAHNGQIANHSDLNKEYNRKFEVDSQHIFQHILENRALSEIKGYGAVVYFQHGKLYMGRFNNGSLAVIKTPLGILFASTQEALTKAAKLSGIDIETFYQIDDEKLYFVEDGQLFKDNSFNFRFGSRYTSYTPATPTKTYGKKTDYHGSYGDDWRDDGITDGDYRVYSYGRWNKRTGEWEAGKFENGVFTHGTWNIGSLGKSEFTPNKEKTKQLTDGKKKRGKLVIITDASKNGTTTSEVVAEKCELCKVDFTEVEESWDSPLGQLCDGCYDVFWNMAEKDREELQDYLGKHNIEMAVGGGTDVREPDPFTVTTVRAFLKSLGPEDVDERSNKETEMTSCDECSDTLTGDMMVFADQSEGKVKWILCKKCHTELTTPFHTNTSFNFPSA